MTTTTTTTFWSAMRARAVLSALVALVAAGSPGCLVRSRCLGDDDCWGNERCDAASGACVLECGQGWEEACTSVERPQCLVAENRCVACLDGDDCADLEQCLGWACVPTQAPGFTLVDANPASPSFGREVSLEDHAGKDVLLFFATLG
jgi:hypothetical protein